MVETVVRIIGCAGLAFVLLYAGSVVRQWVRGIPPKEEWVGGAPMSRTSQLAFAALGLAVSAGIAARSPWFILLTPPIWVVGFFAYVIDRRRYRAALARAWAANAARFPELLEDPPALAADELPDGPFRAFEDGTGTYLGDLTREQLQFLIRWNEEFFAGERNDFFIHELCLPEMEARGADPALIAFLRRALGDRDDLIMRWTLGPKVGAAA